MTPDHGGDMQSTQSFSNALTEAVLVSAADEGGRWLTEAMERIEKSADPAADLSALSAKARRAVGHAELGARGPVLHTADGPVATAAWDLGTAARVALAFAAVQRIAGTGDAPALVQNLYRSGDENEKVAVVCALSAFGLGEALKPIALDAGRTNSVVLFSALAINNPFATAHYTEHEFNQLVLKAVFVEVPVEHVFGLEGRANAALSRMCEDYVDERMAAGRGFPPGLWLALAPYASERALGLMLEAVVDGDAEHRELATEAIARRASADAAVRSLVQNRADMAADGRTRTAYAKVLSATSEPPLSR